MAKKTIPEKTYTDAEIVSRYKKNPTKQMIKILSELNNCSVTTVERILADAGVDITKKSKKKDDKNVIIPESIQKEILKRIDVLNIQIHKATTYIEEYKKDLVTYDLELKQLEKLMEIS